MSFYIMRQNTSIQGSRALDGLPDHMDSLDWTQGKHMDDPVPGGALALDLSLESGNYRSAIIEGFLTLYHKRFRQALEERGVDNIEYYPVQLRDQNTGKVDEDYFVANILGLIDCVDMGKSKVKMWNSGSGFDFQSMVIDEARTHGLKLFRLKDDPTKVIISEEMKENLEQAKILVGVKLIKTEDYSDW
jgi:hypothetical protein